MATGQRRNKTLQYLNLAHWIVRWWNGRHINKYIGDELDKR